MTSGIRLKFNQKEEQFRHLARTLIQNPFVQNANSKNGDRGKLSKETFR